MIPPLATSWQIAAKAALLEAIKADRPLTYNQLATTAAIPSPHKIHQLTSWLEETMREDQSHARPVKAAFVISKMRECPAPGFFDFASDLGLRLSLSNIPLTADTYKAYRAEVHRYYA